VVDAGEGSEGELSKLGQRARGAIALVHNKEMKTFDDLFAEYLRNLPLLREAKKAGVAALLLQSTRAWTALPASRDDGRLAGSDTGSNCQP
jgi:hypothetical protein